MVKVRSRNKEAALLRQRLNGYREASRITTLEDQETLPNLTATDSFAIFLGLYRLGFRQTPTSELIEQEIREVVAYASKLALIRRLEHGQK